MSATDISTVIKTITDQVNTKYLNFILGHWNEKIKAHLIFQRKFFNEMDIEVQKLIGFITNSIRINGGNYIGNVQQYCKNYNKWKKKVYDSHLLKLEEFEKKEMEFIKQAFAQKLSEQNQYILNIFTENPQQIDHKNMNNNLQNSNPSNSELQLKCIDLTQQNKQNICNDSCTLNDSQNMQIHSNNNNNHTDNNQSQLEQLHKLLEILSAAQLTNSNDNSLPDIDDTANSDNPHSLALEPLTKLYNNNNNNNEKKKTKRKLQLKHLIPSYSSNNIIPFPQNVTNNNIQNITNNNINIALNHNHQNASNSKQNLISTSNQNIVSVSNHDNPSMYILYFIFFVLVNLGNFYRNF